MPIVAYGVYICPLCRSLHMAILSTLYADRCIWCHTSALYAARCIWSYLYPLCRSLHMVSFILPSMSIVAYGHTFYPLCRSSDMVSYIYPLCHPLHMVIPLPSVPFVAHGVIHLALYADHRIWSYIPPFMPFVAYGVIIPASQGPALDVAFHPTDTLYVQHSNLIFTLLFTYLQLYGRFGLLAISFRRSKALPSSSHHSAVQDQLLVVGYSHLASGSVRTWFSQALRSSGGLYLQRNIKTCCAPFGKSRDLDFERFLPAISAQHKKSAHTDYL
jgi:hypothetical protein